MNQDTPIAKQIEFYENKINQYLGCIQINEKGTDECKIWISWILGWNNEIIDLKKQL